jgi:transcriptional regulator NrdR family protein
MEEPITVSHPMPCPHCGAPESAIVKTRLTRHHVERRGDSWEVWRRRRCRSCGETFRTQTAIERIVGIDPPRNPIQKKGIVVSVLMTTTYCGHSS